MMESVNNSQSTTFAFAFPDPFNKTYQIKHTLPWTWKGFLAGLSLLLLFVVLVRTTLQYFRLEHFPGPSTTGISKIWLLRTVTSGKMHDIFYEQYKKFGPVIRVAPNSIMISDALTWRRICAPRSPYVRGKWYKGMRFEPDRDMILSRSDKGHEEMRAKMALGYAGRDNQDLEATMDGRITKLLDLIRGKYTSTEEKGYRPFDWGTWANNLTLDVTTQVAFSHTVGNIEANADVLDYHGSVGMGLPVNTTLTVLPWIISILERCPFLHWIMPSIEDKHGYGQILGFSYKRVAERFSESPVVGKDLLGSFLNHGITKSEAEAEMIVAMMAGTDPAATSLRSTILYVLTNPHVHNKLVKEIADKGLIPAPATSEIVSLATAKSLPYFQACIKEGLRIFPPFIGALEKIVPEGGDTLPNGQFVPEGTAVGLNFYGMMRDKAIFGEDVDSYRPERWFVKAGEHVESERLKDMERTLSCVFSAGRFTCLGKDLAIIQVNKVIVELLRRFDLSLIDPLNPWESYSYGIFLQRHLWLRVTEREDAISRD
ncbi:cytochrome P450 [Aulographum hederae CBS 113979]|uniref:Cytochrome P450 n=1 Tax=Aulographum hederae CBS 113979 TaxID=1176131 RepID=A0A6G1GZQ9_9PEZI|nr:cytochrome P450 [Aulographum hederae CBS 113979]